MKNKQYTGVAFQAALQKYVDDSHNGGFASAAKEMGATRASIWGYLQADPEMVTPPKRVLDFFGYKKLSAPKYVRITNE